MKAPRLSATTTVALALALTPSCQPTAPNGVEIEISEIAFRTLETATRVGCAIENSSWQTAQTVMRQTGTVGSFHTPISGEFTEQILVIPHPDLATLTCLEERIKAWPETGTDCTLTLTKNAANAWMVVRCLQ